MQLSCQVTLLGSTRTQFLKVLSKFLKQITATKIEVINPKANQHKSQIGTYRFSACFPVTPKPTTTPPITPATAADLSPEAAL